MGTFMGHFLPGSFFLVFAIWWTINMLRRYYRGRFRHGAPFHASSTYPCTCCCGRLSSLPVEGFLKVFVTSVGLTGEIVTGMSHGHFAHIGNGQHATMFAFFGISGVIDILVHYGVALPKYTDYVFNILCFSVEGLLFMFHLHGRTKFDITVHTLLVYTIWCCVLSLFAEMRYPKNVLCSLARSFFIFLQGTWFIHVGALLYPPFKGMKRWDGTGNDHENIMVATIIFAWHMFFAFTFMFLTAVIMSRIYGRDMRGEMMVVNSKGPGLDRPRHADEVGLMETDDEMEDIELNIHVSRPTDESKLMGNGP